jgi:hypothetical protein
MDRYRATSSENLDMLNAGKLLARRGLYLGTAESYQSGVEFHGMTNPPKVCVGRLDKCVLPRRQAGCYTQLCGSHAKVKSHLLTLACASRLGFVGVTGFVRQR